MECVNLSWSLQRTQKIKCFFDLLVGNILLFRFCFHLICLQVSILAALSHDSVWLYALALHETLSENGDPYDGYAITQRMWNRTITGLAPEINVCQSETRRMRTGGRIFTLSLQENHGVKPQTDH